MKRAFLFALLMSFTHIIWAGPVTGDEARLKALQFVNSRPDKIKELTTLLSCNCHVRNMKNKSQPANKKLHTDIPDFNEKFNRLREELLRYKWKKS